MPAPKTTMVVVKLVAVTIMMMTAAVILNFTNFVFFFSFPCLIFG